MYVVVVPGSHGDGALLTAAADGTATGDAVRVTDLAAAVASREVAEHPRWVWADTADCYRGLLDAGTRVDRCHDLALTEALLLGHEGHWGAPRSLAAAWARLSGAAVPADPGSSERAGQPTLFEPDRSGLPADADPVDATVRVLAEQLRRIARTDQPERFGLLVAAESAGALAAVEMSAAGLPWRSEVHREVLNDLLGPQTPPGVRPERLSALADEVSAAFGGRRLNPDSPAELMTAFAAAGHPLESTRSWVLKAIDHPAVPPLLAYKELARIHAANGWVWQQRWVQGGRFRPQYVPGGVVSGRWATSGGGGLQIPRRLRRAVLAEDGHLLVVADAGQLEPRVLAALSLDPAMARAATDDDLYAAIAQQSFGGDRARAKVGLLGAMYGQTGGQAAAPLAVLRSRYPAALALLEDAARRGERGALVSSHLGRTCPAGADDAEPTGPAARARGRFTRNFVVQATAAEWALSWLAGLRRRLSSVDGAELVFFVHDEIVVHAPAEAADAVSSAVLAAAADASGLLFGATPVRFPLDVDAVRCYADAH